MLDILLTPALDSVPMKRPSRLQEREEIYASAKTAIALAELEGKDPPENAHDAARARQIFAEGRSPTRKELQRPALVIKLEAMLSKYDQLAIADADKLRKYITGKLLQESHECERPSDRLRALELLGKITDVGLFTERHEVTVKQQGTKELEEALRGQLAIMVGDETAH